MVVRFVKRHLKALNLNNAHLSAVAGVTLVAAGTEAVATAGAEILTTTLAFTALTSVAIQLWLFARRASGLERRLGRLEARLVKTEKYASRAVYYAQRTPGDVGTKKDNQNVAYQSVPSIQSGQGRVTATSTTASQSPNARFDPCSTKSFFDPTFIPAHIRPNGTGSRGLGRSAAAIPDDPDTQAKLWSGLTTKARVRDIRVLTVVTPALEHALGKTFSVLPLYPAALNRGLLVGAVYVVIEVSALRNGPWFGTETSAGTALFRELSEFIQMARTEGVATVLIRQGEPPSHFSSEWNSLIDVIVDGEDLPLRWASDSGTSVLRFIGDWLREGNK